MTGQTTAQPDRAARRGEASVDTQNDAFVEASLQTIPNGFGFISANVIDVVQDWVDGASPNYGVAIEEDFGPNNKTSYRASEYLGAVAERPKLTVCYIP